MQKLIDSVRNFRELEDTSGIHTSDSSTIYHQVISGIHDLCLHITQCEHDGIGKEAIINSLSAVRTIYKRSPFLARLSEWPRGYPGDFETIEYLCNAVNQAPKASLEYYCEQHALNCAAAQQHRNKVRHQADIILDTIIRSDTEATILSIASGSNRDIRLLARYINALDHKRVTFVMNDMDENALEFSKDLLKDSKDCHYVHGYVIRKMKPLERLGPYDLVLAGGVFDYMTDKHITSLIKSVHKKLLKPGGRFFFTNIAKGNPYRPWMEYFVNWSVIERTEDDFLCMTRNAGLHDTAVTIRRDETGLTLLVEIQKTKEL